MLELERSVKLARPAKPAVDSALPPQHPLWRRIGKHPALMHYNRLIALVVLVNLAVLWLGSTRYQWWASASSALGPMARLVVFNIALAVIIRQQYVINLLFKLATSVPTSWPLRIRWLMGKVYHFGGLHVGGAVMGTVWFALFVGTLTYSLIQGQASLAVGTVAITYVLLALLIMLIVLALPPLRARSHDRFERSHRFGGWMALLLFWVHTLLFINDQRGSGGYLAALSADPSFWLLLLVTLSIALPWLRLRKVPIKIESPSAHVALVEFDYGVTPFAGSSTTISRSPLIEWHSFANVPAPGKSGYRLTISRAGDWTGQFIDDQPSHVWVKGIPTAGVGNIEKLFKRVVWIATGSGIGPTLPHLLSQNVPARLVWSTRAPRATYGDTLVDEILAVQPDALIWDTSAQGRPDLVQLAYAAYRDFDAEAVICISNKKLTWEVVYGMESRGIPAYGAIWDS